MSVEVDLSNCDREPIHVPGAIQPHGALLVIDEEHLEVLQVSENVLEMLGEPPDRILGRPFSDHLDPASEAGLRAVLEGDVAEATKTLPLVAAGRLFDASLHRHAEATILELEPSLDDDRPGREPLIREALGRIGAAGEPHALHEEVVAAFQRLTGFDRVLLYRFDEDAHGQVVAEVKADEQAPYLGLHFPASDIPKQARDLYRLNPIRIIPDAAYAPVPIVPALNRTTGDPLDLSHAVLRSVSPIHREYMHNMGVRASMSLSVLHEGALWGLISCHHRSPRLVSHRVRLACEILARTVGLQNSSLLADRERVRRDRLTSRVARIAERLGRGGNLATDDLVGDGRLLCDAVDASGVAVSIGARWWTQGTTPPADILDALRRHVVSRATDGIYATKSLSKEWPLGTEVAPVASGILAIVLPKVGREVIWFRPEAVEEVRWAGNPNEPVDVGASGRLRPRTSFGIWQQEVRGRSRGWGKAERAAARDLKRRIIEADLAYQLDRAERAIRARDDVMAVVSHDLRNPLGALSAGIDLLRGHVASFDGNGDGKAAEDVVQRMRRSMARMEQLIGDLLDAARIDAGTFVVMPTMQPLAPVLEEAVESLSAEAHRKAVRVHLWAPDAIRAYCDHGRIYQVVVNLLANAIRHTPPGGRVRVIAKRSGGEVLVTVADSGRGIPPGRLETLFDRYWQEAGGGTGAAGLGLFIARGIVEAHGGRIWAEGRMGTGARFRFVLPALASRADSVQDAGHERRAP
jgi:two-component system, chemotaxis family, sensor kinase Cph1